jgi:prepilin-type N-terminal cleavage/methylation domain-containing protein
VVTAAQAAHRVVERSIVDTASAAPDRTRPRFERGFTLVELLVVIAILGILSAVVVYAVGGIGDRGQSAACKADERTLRAAIETYRASPAHAAADTPTIDDLVQDGVLQQPSALFTISYSGRAPVFDARPGVDCSAPK